MLGLCVDMLPVTFFAYVAGKRGLAEYQSGIILGCYDFGRLISGPLCANVVSNDGFLVVCPILKIRMWLTLTNQKSGQGDKPCNIIYIYIYTL